MARACIFRIMDSKRNANSLAPRKEWPEYLSQKCTSKMQEHIRSGVDKITSWSPEQPETESPEEIVDSRGTTYSLRNGRFRRELSQNKLISESV